MIEVFLKVTKAILSEFGLAGGGGSSSGGGGGGHSSSHSSHSSSSHRSSSSSSGGGDFNIWAFLICLAVVFGSIYLVVFIVWVAAKRKARQDEKNGVLQVSGNGVLGKEFRDHKKSENSRKVHELANEIFYKYQEDWSEFNVDGVRDYTTPEYFEHAKLMLEALKDSGRRNVVSEVKISSTSLDREIPDEITEPVTCRIKFYFSALDEVINEKTGGSLFSKKYSGISETWNFVFDGEKLRLSGISQPTEAAEYTYRLMADFAKENKLFYSPDWGRYCLPDKGLIFNKQSLYSSDVNNHVIGKWGEVLIQLYTYAPNPGIAPYYLVGQLNVPKEYLGIILKDKRANIQKPSDYDKFELEWGEFNEKYEVFASKHDAMPAFELLEPQFMAMLYDKDLNYSIEVIGNAIYIFAPVRVVKESEYKELLDVLVEAHKRLKR